MAGTKRADQEERTSVEEKARQSFGQNLGGLLAQVSLQLNILGETPGDVLEALADLGYTVSEGLAAQEGLELSGVCNDCRVAEGGYKEPEDPYDAGAFYLVLDNPSGQRSQRVLYYSGSAWYEVGNNQAVDVSDFVIGDKLEL